MEATGSAWPRRGASVLDADANMNCTKRRPEEATSDVEVPAGRAATIVTSVTRSETAETVAKNDYVSQWRWPDLAVQLFIHVGCLYGFYLMVTSVKVFTLIWGKSRGFVDKDYVARQRFNLLTMNFFF